jgi:hypothetical protein
MMTFRLNNCLLSLYALDRHSKWIVVFDTKGIATNIMEGATPQASPHFYPWLQNSNEIWDACRLWFLGMSIILCCSLGSSNTQHHGTFMDRSAPRGRGRIHFTHPWSIIHQETTEAMEEFLNTNVHESLSHIECLDNEALHRREITLDVLVDVEVMPLFLNTSNTYGRDTKYL